MTHEEYFALLAKSDVKLEYHGGEIIAMAGSQASHHLIAANLIIELGHCLKKTGIQATSSSKSKIPINIPSRT